MRDLLAVRFTAFDYGPDTISLASTPLYLEHHARRPAGDASASAARPS